MVSLVGDTLISMHESRAAIINHDDVLAHKDGIHLGHRMLLPLRRTVRQHISYRYLAY